MQEVSHHSKEGRLKEGIWESDIAQFQYKNDVLYCVYYPLKDNKLVDLAYAQRIVKERQAITKGLRVRMIVDVNHLSGIHKDARAYWATKESTQDVLKGAVLASSTFLMMIVNFFFFIDRPEVPSKLFTSLESAEKWVRL